MSPSANPLSPVTVHVIAEDAENYAVKSYDGTADLASNNDPNATLPATVTFKNGQATFQVTFTMSGSQGVTVSDSSDSSITGTGSTNVATTSAATHFALAIPQGVAVGSNPLRCKPPPRMLKTTPFPAIPARPI